MQRNCGTMPAASPVPIRSMQWVFFLEVMALDADKTGSDETRRKLIAEGKKTADQVITMAETKHPLTDEQKAEADRILATMLEAAQSDYDRKLALLNNRISTPSDVDRSRAALVVAKAQLDMRRLAAFTPAVQHVRNFGIGEQRVVRAVRPVHGDDVGQPAGLVESSAVLRPFAMGPSARPWPARSPPRRCWRGTSRRLL